MTIFQLVNVLFIASLCQLLLFILFLVVDRKGNWRLNINLVLILMFMAIPYSSAFFMVQRPRIDYLPLVHISGATFFFVGPLLYLYLRKYLSNRFLSLKSDIFHIILFLFVLVPFGFFTAAESDNYSASFADFRYYFYFIPYCLLYIVFSLILIIRYKNIPIAERRPLFWPVFLFTGNLILQLVGGALFFIWIVCPAIMLNFYASRLYFIMNPYSFILYLLAFIIFINILIFFTLRGIQVVSHQSKYRYSRLSPEGKKQYEKKIREWIEKERPYLNPLLSLDGMALSLGISSKDLSQILNECFTLNFADFINSYRVQEAIRLLENDTENRTILDISLEAGFNAKSTFNLVFKKHTGISPREYLKKVLMKKSSCT
jgi:AraC-like DNA-binding protein